MANTLSNWIKVFSDCEIPILYTSKHRIYELQRDEQDITVSVLTEIARQDPGFSISLLRHAGRSTKKEITTLSHAISLISIPLVIKMLTESPLLEKVLDKNTAAKIFTVYAHQYQIAYMAKEWSVLRKESENNEVFTAALNRGFIRFLLYIIDPNKADKLENIYLSPDENHKIKEKELLGYYVDEIAQAISQNWQLPELIRESYSGKHHNPKITGIRLATEFMHQIVSHSSIHYPEELINRAADYIRIPAIQTPGKINWIIIHSIRNSHQYLPYQPLLRLMMSYTPSIKKESNLSEVLPQQKNIALSHYIKLLRSNNSNSTTHELIEIAVTAMKECIDFSRVVFMSFDSNEKCLKMYLQKINKDLPNLKQFSISLELNKLFNQLLKKEQTLCINSKNQHKFSNLLPNPLRPMRTNATIIIHSFYVNKKIAGCMFVDHGQTDKPLTSNELQSFKTICTELKAAIESTIIKRKSAKRAA
jgi:HD-like signal output (HDOD) protein